MTLLQQCRLADLCAVQHWHGRQNIGFTLIDHEVFAIKDNRLGHFTGDRPTPSALRDSVASSPVSGGARIRCERWRVLSCQTGSIFDLWHPLLLLGTACFGEDGLLSERLMLT